MVDKRWHISPVTGKPDVCTAEPGHCPYGGQHYDNETAANRAAEEQIAREVNGEGGGQSYGGIGDMSFDERLAVAGDPSTSPEDLSELARDSDEDVRLAAFRNPSYEPNAMDLDFDDQDPDEFVAFASHAGITIDEISWLTSDAVASEIRCAMAEAESTNPDVLRELSKDEDPDVLIDVADNPSAPPVALDRLSRGMYPDVRTKVASNPSAPPVVFDRLSRDANPFLRGKVANNPNTLPE